MIEHDPGRYHRLRVFISSTGDLQAERTTVENTLSTLDIDGVRFEAWPSTPNPPIPEAMQRLAGCDAIVLLLGRRYGTRTESGISVTHLEYRHAHEKRKPIFAYVLEAPDREAEQDLLIKEVRQQLFHCLAIRSPEELRWQVRPSFIDEFTRCFREVHSGLPRDLATTVLRVSPSASTSPGLAILPIDYSEALSLLRGFYETQDDGAIHVLAEQVEARFPNQPDILNFVYMAEVNLAMKRKPVDLQRIRRAVGHWTDSKIRERYRDYTFDFCLGNALGVLDRLPEAIERYQAAIRSNRTFAQVWKNLGTAYVELGNYKEGRACIEESLRLNPRLFEALYSLGTLSLEQEKDPEVALSYFNRIISAGVRRDRLGGVYGWRAIAQEKLGRLAEGIASAEDAIAITPDAKWAWRVAARLYALARRQDNHWLEPAARFWQRFLVRFSGDREAWVECGRVHWALWQESKREGDGNLSLAAFTKATELGLADEGFLWDRIGHLRQAVGNLAEAEVAFRRAVDLDPSRFGYCLGVCLISMERYEEALLLVKPAAERDEGNARGWFQVGLCQGKLGAVPAAVEAYERAIALDPDYPHPRFNLGGLYWNCQDSAKALEIWREAIARFPNHPLVAEVQKLMRP